MRPLLPCTLLALGVLATSAHATMLGGVVDRLDFTRPNELATKATWGAENGATLDFTADGIGYESLPEKAFFNAWVQTHPMPLGGNGYPYPWANLTVAIDDHLEERGLSKIINRIFARHSPDLKHWTSWQPLRLRSDEEWQAMPKRFNKLISSSQTLKESIPTIEVTATQPVTFVGSLEIPRTVENRYSAHAAVFRSAGIAHPRGHEDLVRWILAKDPDYFATEIPFVGYLQLLVEFNARSGSHRLRQLSINVFSLEDWKAWIPAEETPDSPRRWNFVAP